MHTHSFRFGTLRAGLGYQDIRDALDPELDDGSFFGWIDFIID
jgi:hypothetical protein